MASRPVKLKLLPRSTIKAKSLTRIAGQIQAGTGAVVTKANGIWTISLDITGLGIVIGPSGVVDNAVPRFNGTTGSLLQSSPVLISDDGLITGGTWQGAVIATTYGGTGQATAFLQNGTGAVERGWQDKLRDIVCIKDFGAEVGGADCLAAFDAAAAALSSGGTIYVPHGAWYVSDEFELPNAVNVLGESPSTTKIVTTHATANVIKCSVGNNRISNIGIFNDVTRTAPGAGEGAAIYIDDPAFGVVIDNVIIDSIAGTGGSAFVEGIHNASTHSVQINRCRIANLTATTGVGIVLGANGGGARIDHCIVSGAAGATPFAALLINASWQTLIYGCDFLLCAHGLYENPGNGQVSATLKSVSTFYDNNVTTGVTFAPSGTGKVLDHTFVDSWFSNTSIGKGLLATGGGSTQIDGIAIIGGQAYNNLGNAIDVSAVTNFQVLSGFRAANNGGNAITVAGTCSKVTIIGNELGPTGGSGANGGHGISLAGTLTDLVVRHNNVSGNTGGAITSTAAYSGHSIIADNPGYNTNPVSAGIIYYTDAVSPGPSNVAKVTSTGIRVGTAGSVRGSVAFDGSTSGTLTVQGPATASGTLTLPAGTTDFTSTGGASQVVKQASAGGALTVAQLAASDLTSASFAAQSDQETGSSTSTIVTPGRQHFHQSAAKAWLHVTVSGGTPTIAASYNITSVTDAGVGQLSVTIATDFSSANYCLTAVINPVAFGDVISPSITSAGTFSLFCGNATPAFVDPNAYWAACFGDQ